MASPRKTLRGALTIASLAATAAIAACSDDPIDILEPDLEDAMFRSYVALGNSITAGYQSGGILDSTQLESYAFYVYRSFGFDSASYNYARLQRPGCPPPVVNFTTGARLQIGMQAGGSTFCALRSNTERTLNNVAVPGATVLDPTSASTVVGSNALTTFILGGRSQVGRALEANPTFVTAWIGNNDVLAAAVTGLTVPTAGGVPSPGITSAANFVAAYKRMADSIMLAPRLEGGVLIGVVDVTNAPILFESALLASPAVREGLRIAAGRTVPLVIDASCTNSTALISLRIIDLLRANPAVPGISCTKGANPAYGDFFVVDAGERTALNAAVTAYNTYIQAKADTMGFAYYDPNTTLAPLKASGEIPAFPNLASATAPFGTYFSLDGVHPSRRGHQAIAAALLDVINAEYGTTLDLAGNGSPTTN